MIRSSTQLPRGHLLGGEKLVERRLGAGPESRAGCSWPLARPASPGSQTGPPSPDRCCRPGPRSPSGGHSRRPARRADRSRRRTPGTRPGSSHSPPACRGTSQTRQSCLSSCWKHLLPLGVVFAQRSKVPSISRLDLAASREPENFGHGCR